jgi:hypothetical protein
MRLIELVIPIKQLTELVLNKRFDVLADGGYSDDFTNIIIDNAIQRYYLEPCLPSDDEFYRAIGHSALTFLGPGYLDGEIPEITDDDDYQFTEGEMENIVIEGDTDVFPVDVLIQGNEETNTYLMLGIDAKVCSNKIILKVRNMFIS